jgi:hypothetical protein
MEKRMNGQSFSYPEIGQHKYNTYLFWFFLQGAFAKSELASSQVESEKNMKNVLVNMQASNSGTFWLTVHD